MKKVSLIILIITLMCTVTLCLNAMPQELVHLIPIYGSSYDPGMLHERHRIPMKILVFKEDEIVYIQNAPVGGQVSFYDEDGNLLKEETISASECTINKPALAVTIEICYGNITLRGNLIEEK